MKNKVKNKYKEFKKGDRSHFRVAIFGSARIKKNDAIYKRVKTLATMLAKQGIDVVTGGGAGLMQAANEGHGQGAKKSSKKSHSIGIGIRLLWDQKFNESVVYKKEYNRFSKRLDEFMLLSNAIIVAPGGLGTLLELFYTWQLVQVHHICDIPIILMGDTWRGLLKWIKKDPLARKYLDEKDYRLVFYVQNPKEAMTIINENHKQFKKGEANFCLNYKKYKL